MKIKQILLDIELTGNGIVNFDSNDQKKIWNYESRVNGNKNKFTTPHNNVKYAKKNYYRDDNGVLGYKIKLSGDVVKKAVFADDAVATNGTIQHHKALLNAYIGSIIGMVRGYLFINDKKNPHKKKSPLTITDAEQTNNAESVMEITTRSGEKKIKTSEDDGGDTTFTMQENIGHVDYQALGNIDLSQIQFISGDSIFDRKAFNPDDFELLSLVMGRTLPSGTPKLGYYTLKSSSIDMPEYGLSLQNNDVVFLVKETLKRILNIEIMRAKAFTRISNLRIKLVTKATEDIYNKEEGWITIKSEKDVDNLDFEPDTFYVEYDCAKAHQLRKEIEEGYQIMVERDKKEKF